MRFIPTRVHGILDYIVGLLLIAAPWIFGFADGSWAQWAPILVGVAALIYSLLTDYELGLANVISMPTHLWLDALSGLFLALSPWLFGFADRVWWPHGAFGAFEILAALVTQRVPATRDALAADRDTSVSRSL